MVGDHHRLFEVLGVFVGRGRKSDKGQTNGETCLMSRPAREGLSAKEIKKGHAAVLANISNTVAAYLRPSYATAMAIWVFHSVTVPSLSEIESKVQKCGRIIWCFIWNRINYKIFFSRNFF